MEQTMDFYKRYKELDKEAGKYNRKEFDKVYSIISDLVKDRTDVGDNGNLAFPLVSGSVIDEALKQAGFTEDTQFASDFKKYREIEQQAREIQLKSIEIACEHMQKGSNINEAMEMAGFVKNNELQSILNNTISEAKRENPYFPYGKPFEDLIKGDESLDELLRVDGYKINGKLYAFYNDLQRYKVGDLLDKIGIGLKGIFELLNGMCDFMQENTEKPIRIQNKIKDCLDCLNEYPGSGQVVQILFLQGITEWFKHCDINDESKGFDEAQTLCNWVYERLIDVCIYYFMFFYKNSDSEPLDNYLTSSQIGEFWSETQNLRTQQQEEIEEKGMITLPDELNTDRAKKYFKKAMEYSWIKPTSTGYHFNKSKTQLAYFTEKVFCPNKTDEYPETALNKLFGVSRLGSARTQIYNAKKPQKWRPEIDDFFTD